MPDIIIFITARLKSTHFPNKKLASIKDKSVIQHSHMVAYKVNGIRGVFIATVSEEIAHNVRSIGAHVIMTDELIRNGTEQTAQALKKFKDLPDLIFNFPANAPLKPHGLKKISLKWLIATKTQIC